MDPETGLCLTERDTAWHAISLLVGDDLPERARGNGMLRSLASRDGTHTPATFLIILHALRHLLEPATVDHLENQVRTELVHAAEVVHRDGNVNHPLGAYAALILGGELCDAPWAVVLGYRRLLEFQRRTGDHRDRYRRQAEMSEYNSLTYTALDLCFLAAVAEYARDPDSRRLALFLEERLWVNVAMRFHAPSHQYAGPHSRSYAEDSMGGFSALHCTMLVALGCDLFIDPQLPERFTHPSNLLQNALPAILPFHVPETARQIALQKPFPYHLRVTTFGESYQENNRRHEGKSREELVLRMNGMAVADSPTQDSHTGTFAFDDEVYHGGWSELTSYMTEEYALGSASLPYVNAGHADAVMVRIARRQAVRSVADFRSGFTRGAFNGLLPGRPGSSHAMGTTTDGSFFVEEGRTATYQHKNRLIVCYAPKRTGHLGLSEYRTDFVWGYHAPFDRFAVDGSDVGSFPRVVGPGAAIVFQDGDVFGLLLPLLPRPAPDEAAIEIRTLDEFLLVSCWNHRGRTINVTRDQLSGWHTGFYLELHRRTEFVDFGAFTAYAAGTRIQDRPLSETARQVIVASGENTMQFTYDPYRELILSRTWNGEEEGITHLEVEAAGRHLDPFCPPSLFGSELRS